MTGLAIIGGTGLTSLKNLEIERREVMHTPYGEPSGPLVHGKMCGRPVVFIPRHGTAHTIPPHEVNYRANLWALDHIGITKIIAVAAVGGITVAMAPQTLVIPDQIIDYTWARQHTFFQGDLARVTHIDFTHPYSADLRGMLLQAGRERTSNCTTVAPTARRKAHVWKPRPRSSGWNAMAAISSA